VIFASTSVVVPPALVTCCARSATQRSMTLANAPPSGFERVARLRISSGIQAPAAPEPLSPALGGDVGAAHHELLLEGDGLY
jgi:hypothetical protein